MALGKRLINTGAAAAAACTTDSVQAFGADAAYSSNIAVYQFNGNPDDTTGTYDGTESGTGSPTYVTGKYGQAISFNNDYQFVNTGITPSILGNSFSFSAWVYFTSNPGGSDYYGISGAYAAGSGGAGAGQPQSWIFYMSSGGALTFFSNLTSGSVSFSGGTITLNQWNFIAFSVDDQNEISVYLNGNQTTQSVSNSLNGNNVALCLGNPAPYNSTRGMIGLMDQARVFNRKITSSEAEILYNETDSTTSNTNPFNEGAGLALYSLDYDASEASGSYDATPTNVDFGVGGQINTAARFNGSNSFIQTSLSLNAASNTVSFWFNADAVGSQNPALYFNNRGGRIDIVINGTSSNTPTVGYDSIYINSTTAITGWNFVSIVFTGWASSYSAGSYGSAITANVYLNGGSAVSLSPTPYGQSDGLRIGRSGGGYYYDGDIDQVRIFNKALDSTEVGTLYSETACVYTSTTDIVNYPTGTTPVAYYKLDNSSEDFSTGGNDGTDTNIEYRFGRYGQAAVFSGSGSYIQTSLALSSTDVTTSFWFNPDAINNNNCALYFNSHGGRIDIIIAGNSSNTSTVAGNNLRVNSTDIIIGNWSLCTVVFEGFASPLPSTVTAKVYINGSFLNQVTPVPYAQTTGMRIGRSGGSLYYDGKIDQVRIYDAALTASQIAELYNEKPEVDTSNFKAVLYDGNGGSQYISNVGFQPDLTWIKSRTANAYPNNVLQDSVRGANKYLISDSTFSEATNSTFGSFDANGFTLTSANVTWNGSGSEYVSWNWKAGGDAVNIGVNSITGSTPSIASDVSANTAAGFSIVKYTGNEGSTAKTVGHGLSSAPEIIIAKGLNSSSYDWAVYSSVTGNTKKLALNQSNAQATSGVWNDTSPTNSVFSVRYDQNNATGTNYVAYCWHSVAGYSKIGTYAGNSSTNKITLDFAPSWVMIKLYDVTGGNWFIYDNKRNPSNPADLQLEADTSNQDTDHGTVYELDFLSDGFELQGAGGAVNTTGRNYLYMAFK